VPGRKSRKQVITVLPWLGRREEKILTTSAILAAWAVADKTIIKLRILHPDSLNCLPPERITRYATMAIPSMTTAKDMRKPTLRHMEQK
jgi:hypothetical protein